MSARFHTSAPTGHFNTRDRSWQTPWQRERKHGRYIQPLHEERMCGLQWVSNGVVVFLALLIAALSARYGWNW